MYKLLVNKKMHRSIIKIITFEIGNLMRDQKSSVKSKGYHSSNVLINYKLYRSLEYH